MAVRAEPAAAATGPEAAAAAATPGDGARWLLPAGAVLLVAVLGLYVADLATHLSSMAAMRDLVVYRNGGLIARHVAPAYDGRRASPLYDWTGSNGVQFTYPPFAAVVFAVASVLSWTAMRWAMTLASLAALGLSLWLVFGALGYAARPRIRLGATFGAAALALLTEPVQETLGLGQANLLLMLLVVADLLTPSVLAGRTRWWHGIGIGVAAGVKLTPLIFIPYLLLVRRYRQAATAAGTFAATVALGYAILPRDSGTYWWHRLFLNANRIVFLGTRGNQSLRGGGDPAGRQRDVRDRSVGRGGHPDRGGRAGGRGRAVPRRVPGGGHAGLCADRAAGVPADLGSPLGLGRAGYRAAGSPGRPGARRRPRPWWSAGGGLVLVFGAWPQFWELSQAGLTPAGLFWYGPATYFATGDQPWYHEFHWHGLQLLAGNIFVLAGLAGLAALCVSAFRVRHRLGR